MDVNASSASDQICLLWSTATATILKEAVMITSMGGARFKAQSPNSLFPRFRCFRCFRCLAACLGARI
jgi:hypothetical protein